jgi:hypothetical protein
MSKFAKGTDVSPEKSQMQISKMLRDFKCSSVMMGYENERAFIGFIYGKTQVRMFCPIVKSEPENRRRWRVLRIVIQSKFEIIHCGIKSFEEEFFADIVMPNGMTVSQMALPAVNKALDSGIMPSSLLALPG